jgi:hypothetical protein
MELQWAQQLFQGKRIDEVMFDIPFMTPDQLGELGLCLFDLTFSMEAGKNDHVYDEVYEAMADRREYYTIKYSSNVTTRLRLCRHCLVKLRWLYIRKSQITTKKFLKH